MSFKLINNIAGWLVFAFAAFVFIATMEPTASFWDCGEFIAVSYKLMVPHPPGAPLFLLIGRLFSLFASDVTQVAYMVNLVSALSSAFAVLFLFWSITLLAKKLYTGKDYNKEPDTAQMLTIIGAGIVGACSFTFADSFWFSAVEAEVYAISTFFTAIVFWAMLKWETIADEKGADRWLILIGYLVGLSIGVHLLNLLTVPALAYIYYFRKYQPTNKGMVATLGISFFIIVLILNGVIPGLPSIAGSFEVFFVNTLSLPFGSGITFFAILFIAGLVYGILYSIRKSNALLNTALLAFSFVLIGYLSYGIIVIRANFHTPINENSPDNVLSFVSYLKREQYGDRPLLFGPQFSAEPIKQKKGAPIYIKGKDKYEIVAYKTENEYASKDRVFLPRMHSSQPGHIAAYGKYVKLRKNEDGTYKTPSFMANMEFMFRYQIGVMFWRYFFWNFSGKGGDAQWADSIWPFDSKAGMPDSIAANKGINQFYALPFILGLAGLAFHVLKNGKNALIIGLLFFFTGIAIVLFTNQPPIEPRERDYTFAGAMFSYCIWIGLGVVALAHWLRTALSNGTIRAIAVTAVCLLVPYIMGAQGWDDHDRSRRFHSVDSAKNLLNSCAPNAILFTGGDNDTFPLWYVQEVEGFRTDVRVCNLSLLGTDWYISQMKRKAYLSEALPITLDEKNYTAGKNEYLPYYNEREKPVPMDLKTYIAGVNAESTSLQVQGSNQQMLTIVPTKQFTIPIDSVSAKAWLVQNPGLGTKVASSMMIDLGGRNALYKNELVMLDMIANNNWKRPIYFSTTLSNSNYIGLKPYMYMEGLAYRLSMSNTPGANQGEVNTEVMYTNLMTKMFWRGLDDPTIYYDENYKRFPLNSRNSFFRLAIDLYSKGDTARAKKVVEYCFKVMPDKAIPYDPYTPQFIPLLLRLGEKAKADAMGNVIGKRLEEELTYYQKHGKGKPEFADGINNDLYMLQSLTMAYRSEGMEVEAKKYDNMLQNFNSMQEAYNQEEE